MAHNKLILTNVTKRFGGLTAVDDLSMTVEDGQIYGIIGPNGAGKTTVLTALPVSINLRKAPSIGVAKRSAA